MAAQRTRLTFPADTSATAVCEAVQSVDLPLDREEQNLARYALIEVVTNAVRAASEAGADGAVSARILADEDQVRIVVEDGAGGFDVKCLPYDYGADPDGIDVTDAAFDEYREKFDDQRLEGEGLGSGDARGVQLPAQ